MEIYVEDSNDGVRLYDPAMEGSYYYVLQTPRNKALRVKQFCEANGVEAIVPLHYQDVMRRGKSSCELVSALDDLVYIKADLERLRWVKRHLPYLTYVKEEGRDGGWKKSQLYIGNEVVEFFKLLESNYLSDILIVSKEDTSDDNFTQINTRGGIFDEIPLFFENVKGVDHKCLTMTLDYDTVIAVKSLTPESFMTQDCLMRQVVDGEIKTQYFPLVNGIN